MEGSQDSKWVRIRVFFLIFVLHSLSIYLFTRGFLLTRTELSDSFSSCSDIPDPPCTVHHRRFNGSDDSSGVGGGCWTPPVFHRIVIIVLDALRFDFVAPSAFFEEVKPWMDKLTVLQRLALEESSSAKIFKAIADPPTTSLLRLKGLTTGGLPTFIDVGNSFGAPAITEDNLIHQLVSNGKRVLMMGDDTWLQVFPHHFQESYPFPSFNVKDLHVVDDGVMEHLIPSLYKDDWDVLIAHFLGVDHAGHIFGVDSTPMIEKLEQYNNVLEKVVEALKNQSGPGQPHENTLLLVMGDHGQTLNGDHGGGTAEEVETSLFAMSFGSPPDSVPPNLDSRTCKFGPDGEKMCFSSMQQLDFAATISALLGIPSPFGSIGRVNPELYALSAKTWNIQNCDASNCKVCSNLEAWMTNYMNVLCINCWQVKRYIDLYSATSVIGFSKEDMLHLADVYGRIHSSWSNAINAMSLEEDGIPEEIHNNSVYVLQQKIDASSNFLAYIAEIARLKWTEFDLKLMGAGLCMFFVSLLVHFLFIIRVVRLCKFSCTSIWNFRWSCMVSSLLVATRASSFLSNSYILEEGKVASFLLATTGILSFRGSVNNGKLTIETLLLLLFNILLGCSMDDRFSKQAIGSAYMSAFNISISGINISHFIWTVFCETSPLLFLSMLALLLYRCTSGMSHWGGYRRFFVNGTIVSYVLIGVHWILESNSMNFPEGLQYFGRIFIPLVIYASGCGLLLMLVIAQIFVKKGVTDQAEGVVIDTVAMSSACSPIILVLSGRQGPFVALISILGVWCIIRLSNVALKDSTGVHGVDPVSVTQWSLLAACLFFYTGHRCSFDGLRFGAAFIGFDEFDLIRQGTLLFIETFGFSHIIPILSLPFLVTLPHQVSCKTDTKGRFFLKLAQVFLTYGFITAITTAFTMVCVTIQRRHLMVWGLFAPKFLFDVVGLILTDVLICLASLFYM
ncbi:hypothetical protein QJS10_CPA05g00052 [Acorus calamus]|uniref:GPI ethanolamine phosphate transferase 2 C-terminal domain-containing protein n=1 Tax=Acorus calamus TaxID=4465 RepID=A0AAV9ETW1_ACOCL|nr:hypothetical protein QJS10_CPA05g00052 [Acorus calamus]